MIKQYFELDKMCIRWFYLVSSILRNIDSDLEMFE